MLHKPHGAAPVSRDLSCARHADAASLARLLGRARGAGAGQMDETKTGFLRALASDRRFQAMLGLGFSQGIPYLLVYATQSAWLMEAKVPLGTIGLLSEMTLAYRFKFLWAPFLERYDAPVFGRWLGRRRGWMIVSQLAVMAALAGLAFGDPAHWLAWTVAFSFALGFAGATQDVVVDGWRIASVDVARQGQMTSIAEMGYRVGILVAGAGALLLADRVGWRGAYLVMASALLPGMIAAFWAPEPEAAAVEPAPRQNAIKTIFVPILDLIRRLGPMALPILVMVAGFRMPGYISNAMAIPLFKSLHYSNTDIGTVTKLFGFWIAIGGVFVAGVVVTRIGIMASLVVGTIAGSASHLALAYLAAHGGGAFWTFALAVGVDGFASAFAQIVLITYMSSLASSAFAGSQFALLTSLVALPGSLLAATSGFAVARLGFPHFFAATSLLGLPIAVLCVWVWRVEGRRKAAAA